MILVPNPSKCKTSWTNSIKRQIDDAINAKVKVLILLFIRKIKKPNGTVSTIFPKRLLKVIRKGRSLLGRAIKYCAIVLKGIALKGI